jgi:hypothetical protein
VAVNVVRETVTVELAGSGVHEEFSPTQISAAAQRVADVARSRAEEGITPFAEMAPLLPRERRDPADRPRRELKDRGEKRLLRDTMDDPEVLEALALLEEGLEERAESALAPARTEGNQPPPARDDRGPQDQRRHHDAGRMRRRDQPPRQNPQSTAEHQPTSPASEPGQGQPAAERPQDHRRRRRRGRHGGER